MKSYQDCDASDWFAAAFGLTVVLMFVTVIVWIWLPEWYVARTVVTEVVLAALFKMLNGVTSP